MQILFLTLVKINSLDERGIYTDLLRKFTKEGHTVSVVCPTERREKQETCLVKKGDTSILKVKTFNLQKTNVMEKGFGTLAIEYQYLSAIRKYFKDIKFDIVIYSTPPITFSKVIQFVKTRDNAYSYLLLKDIFPQNAVDMKMIKENGVLHKMFVKKERKLYAISETIGCMSEANKSYVLEHNPSIATAKVEINPNSVEPIVFNQSFEEKEAIKLKYKLPIDKKIFVYGGNLGKPQGVDFLLETITKVNNSKMFFLVVGSGTEYERIDKWFKENQPENAMLLSGLPKNDYDLLLGACDVGLIFLHKDFTIPNFPSRLLSYLEYKMPIIAATDKNTDIGSVIEKAGCGFWVESGDIEGIKNRIEKLIISPDSEFEKMRENAHQLLTTKYDVSLSYNLIVEKIKNN